jgi:hypothetical protein
MQTHHRKRHLASWRVLVIAATLGGCATSPYLDDHMGDAVRAAVYHQTLGQDSGGPLISSAHQDGKAARSSIDRYLRTFEQPPTALPGVIGRIGGMQGSGSF